MDRAGHRTGRSVEPDLPLSCGREVVDRVTNVQPTVEEAVPATAADVPYPERIAVTVLMPAYNEARNLVEVVPRTLRVLRSVAPAFELIIVDDGSHDGTAELISELGNHHPELRLLHLRRNYGKSTALQAGLDRARGDVIVLMDADGQDQPEEIPRLLRALDGGLDLATGRRAQRSDSFVKRQSSRVYNRVTASVTGVSGKDFNSGLKAMRREVLSPMVLYGELHRYIPVLAEWAGFKVGEVDVSHGPRLHGASKFGRARFWRGFLDLLTVKFITTYTGRPFHLFGGLGALCGVIGTGLLAWMLILRLMGEGVGNRPALLAGILLVVVGVQLLSLGLIAELIVHLRRDRDPVVADED
jgi:glycosyltransferase involved in cell wall biosynthesis